MVKDICVNIPKACSDGDASDLPEHCKIKKKNPYWIDRECRDYKCPIWKNLRVRDSKSINELLEYIPIKWGPTRMLWRYNHFDGIEHIYCIDQWWDRMIEFDNPDSVAVVKLCDGKRCLDNIIKTFSEERKVEYIDARKEIGDFIINLEKYELIKWRTPDGRERLHFLSDAAGKSDKKFTIIAYRNILSYKKASHFEIPVSVYWNITHRCDGKCIMCFANTGKDKEKYYKEQELSTKEVFRIIERLGSAGVTSIVWGGGEPFVRDDLIDIMRKCRECGLGISIPTNGIALSKDMELAKNVANILRHWGYVFQISFESCDSKIHNKIRPGAPWDIVLEAIIRMIDLGLLVTINSVVNRINIDTIDETFDFVRELEKEKNGLAKYRAILFKPIGLGMKNIGKLLPSPKQIVDFTLWLKDMKERYNGEDLIDEIIEGDDNVPLCVRRELNVPLYQVGVDSWGCPAGRLDLNIHPDGSISPCSWLMDYPEWNGENVRDGDIIELWNKSKILEPFRNISPKGRCLKCEYNNYCTGACPAINYAINDDISPPDALCWYDPTNKKSKAIPEAYPFLTRLSKF